MQPRQLFGVALRTKDIQTFVTAIKRTEGIDFDTGKNVETAWGRYYNGELSTDEMQTELIDLLGLPDTAAIPAGIAAQDPHFI